MARNSTGKQAEDAAQAVALQALTYLASDPEELGRFLSLAGIGPETLRASARDPQFLAGVLDHMVSEEALLIAFTKHAGLKPDSVMRAKMVLSRDDLAWGVGEGG